MTNKKISLFGVFGWFNLGNNCTLSAMIFNINRYVPNAKITCICPNPSAVSAEYNIEALQINYLHSTGSENFLQKYLIYRIFRRLYKEPSLWVKTYTHLKDTEILIMTGTGMLDDGSLGPFRLPFDIFRWSIVAKICKTELLFVSVGSGSIFHPLSRWFIRHALNYASYRSYRDVFSKNYLNNIGCKVDKDLVYPDMAFSLPESLFSDKEDIIDGQYVVGIGLMSHFFNLPNHGESIYADYINKMSVFISWLITRGFRVRLLIGDSYLDKRAIIDMINLFEKNQQHYSDQYLIIEPISSYTDLIRQMALTHIVIATRYHNIIMSLLLYKPVISISYHPKNDALLDGIGMDKYHQSIEHLNIDQLIHQFIDLENNYDNLKSLIKAKVEIYRGELDKQYSQIFNQCDQYRQ